MQIFLILRVSKEDNRTELIDRLVDTLTTAKFLREGEMFHFEAVEDTILVYRSKKTVRG
jgi:hypothetical protein